jgi:hypothetical protein
MNSAQLEIPLFPPDMMGKIKEAHREMELQKLRKELSHEKHVKAGYVSAFKKAAQKRKEQE